MVRRLLSWTCPCGFTEFHRTVLPLVDIQRTHTNPNSPRWLRRSFECYWKCCSVCSSRQGSEHLRWYRWQTFFSWPYRANVKRKHFLHLVTESVFHGLSKCLSGRFFACNSKGKERNRLLFVSFHNCNSPNAKNMSSIWHEIMFWCPFIPCRASS